jgi:succinate-semialdehyde dehydrogenase/glutarate-semialdehyde dehydrogenase
VLVSINPATEEILERFDEHSDAQIDERLERAARAFAEHRRLGFAERGTRMRRVGQLLADDRERLARTMVEEMGKTLASARAEVDKCALACRHYADEAHAYLADEPLPGEPVSYLRYLPLGPVLAVMPWNFPLWQVFRFAAPSLMAGNVGLLKHASNVSRCALAIEELFRRAGFADGAFQTLLIGSGRAGRVVEDPRIKAVTLTGSDGAGASVAALAGRSLKKTVLELGGSDPFIILPSADLETALDTAVIARNINNGQSCIAAKRFIVHREIYRRFEEGFAARLARLKVGDPMREDTDVGPLATADGLAHLGEQVARSLDAGARLVAGGKRLPGRGYYYQPSALADIPKHAPAYREEVFGPVALLFEARDLDHAIELANDSPYGLGSSVWTREPREWTRLVDELEAGQTFVNGMVVSHPIRPFGGVKRSGYGRELGALGIREFVNIKTVVLENVKTGDMRGATE